MYKNAHLDQLVRRRHRILVFTLLVGVAAMVAAHEILFWLEDDITKTRMVLPANGPADYLNSPGRILLVVPGDLVIDDHDPEGLRRRADLRRCPGAEELLRQGNMLLLWAPPGEGEFSIRAFRQLKKAENDELKKIFGPHDQPM